MEAATSAWVAGECNLVSGQGLSDGAEAARADLVREAEVAELDAWESFWVSLPNSFVAKGLPTTGRG